ncbi:hypothetical protein DL768_009654 [Monosporascus sp. mg162]|nr:hypothetical protein DL768_009654 [Monosporascus sp. mg162]
MQAPRAATHWKRTKAAVDEPPHNSENRPIPIVDSAKPEKWVGLYLPHRESATAEIAAPGIPTSHCIDGHYDRGTAHEEARRHHRLGSKAPCLEGGEEEEPKETQYQRNQDVRGRPGIDRAGVIDVQE